MDRPLQRGTEIVSETITGKVHEVIDGRLPKKTLLNAINDEILIYNGGYLGAVYLESPGPALGSIGDIDWSLFLDSGGGFSSGGGSFSGSSSDETGGHPYQIGGPITTPVVNPEIIDPCKEAKKIIKNKKYAKSYKALIKNTSLPYLGKG